MAKRAASINTEQKQILLEFVKKRNKLIDGKFTKDFTYKDGQKMWEEVTGILNSVPTGGSKNWKQWRKVWQDMKTKTKNKKAQSNKSRILTGGGPPKKDTFDDIDNQILDVVSKTSISGIDNSKETIVPLYVDIQEVPSTSTVEEEEARIEYYVETEQECSYVSQIKPVGEPNIVAESKTPSRKTIPKSERLQKTLVATENMANLCKEKLIIKENYYKKKLILMEEDVKTKKEIANSLKLLTDLLSKK